MMKLIMNIHYKIKDHVNDNLNKISRNSHYSIAKDRSRSPEKINQKKDFENKEFIFNDIDTKNVENSPANFKKIEQIVQTPEKIT